MKAVVLIGPSRVPLSHCPLPIRRTQHRRPVHKTRRCRAEEPEREEIISESSEARPTETSIEDSPSGSLSLLSNVITWGFIVVRLCVHPGGDSTPCRSVVVAVRRVDLLHRFASVSARYGAIGYVQSAYGTDIPFLKSLTCHCAAVLYMDWMVTPLKNSQVHLMSKIASQTVSERFGEMKDESNASHST